MQCIYVRTCLCVCARMLVCVICSCVCMRACGIIFSLHFSLRCADSLFLRSLRCCFGGARSHQPRTRARTFPRAAFVLSCARQSEQEFATHRHLSRLCGQQRTSVAAAAEQPKVCLWHSFCACVCELGVTFCARACVCELGVMFCARARVCELGVVFCITHVIK